MSLLTKWGYTLTDLEALPDMLSENDFAVFSANKYVGDTRIPAEIRAACAAIRDYVGWHLYPSTPCRLEEYVLYEDGRIKRFGRDLFIQLPAVLVRSITSVVIGDEETTDYVLDTNGILHVFDVGTFSRRTKITVTYIAGLTADMMDGIQELVAHRVTHALASSNGITSEAAGGVSVTYNANWINSARATALPDDNKEVLAPYRVKGVF